MGPLKPPRIFGGFFPVVPPPKPPHNNNRENGETTQRGFRPAKISAVKNPEGKGKGYVLIW